MSMISAIAFWFWLAGAYVLHSRKDKKEGFTKLQRILFIVALVLAITTFFSAGFLRVLIVALLVATAYLAVKVLNIYDIGRSREITDKVAHLLKKRRYALEGKNEFGLYPIVKPEQEENPEEPEEEIFYAGDVPLIPVDDDMNHIHRERLGDTQTFNPYNFRD